METKTKRTYTRRTKQQRLDLLKAKITALETFNSAQLARIEKLKTKLYALENPSLRVTP